MIRFGSSSPRDSVESSPSLGDQESLLSSEKHRKLDAPQLKFYKGLSREKRPAYLLRAVSNGRDTGRLTAEASLTRKGKFLAIGDRLSNMTIRSGYNMFMGVTIMAGLPGSQKLLNAVDDHETDRISARHNHQREPFALDTPGVNNAMRQEYRSAVGNEEQKIAAVADRFAAPKTYVARVMRNRGVVPLPFELGTREINDAIRTAYGKASGCEDDKLTTVAAQLAVDREYIKQLVAPPQVVLPSSSKVTAGAICKAYSEASGCGDEKAAAVARKLGLSIDEVKRAVIPADLVELD